MQRCHCMDASYGSRRLNPCVMLAECTVVFPKLKGRVSDTGSRSSLSSTPASRPAASPRLAASSRSAVSPRPLSSSRISLQVNTVSRPARGSQCQVLCIGPRNKPTSSTPVALQFHNERAVPVSLQRGLCLPRQRCGQPCRAACKPYACMECRQMLVPRLWVLAKHRQALPQLLLP